MKTVCLNRSQTSRAVIITIAVYFEITTVESSLIIAQLKAHPLYDT